MTIDTVFSELGKSIYLMGSDGWKSPLFSAIIEPLRYKNKMYLEGVHTPIGVNKNSVYLYLGPANHDLTKLNDTYRVIDKDNVKYIIDKAEKICLGEKVLYIWAVIRKTEEASYGRNE